MGVFDTRSNSFLYTTNMIASRAIALQKRAEQVALLRTAVYAVRVRDVQKLEEDHKQTLRDFNHQPNTLVLIRNTAIEKSLNRKMRPRYLGPYVVVARNRGGAYIIAELNGAVLDRPIAAFRVLPYFARMDPISTPSGWLDVDSQRIRELEQSVEKGEGAEDADASA